MRGLFILLFIAFCLYLFSNVEPHQIENLLHNQSQNPEESVQPEDQAVLQSEIQSSENLEGVASYIGVSEEELTTDFGEPSRIDLSSYDYEWWIYNDKLDNYMQFGVKDSVVVTAFSTGSHSNHESFQIGQTYESLNDQFSFTESITVLHNEGSYRFQLNEEELATRPLIMIGDIYVQLYFDDFEETLSSVRYLNAETLIKQRPYELVYRGPLIDPKELTDEEWAKVENGNAQQIIDFTNIIRNRFNLSAVEWDEDTAAVAFLHSKDMRESNFFSHTSPTTGSLSERLMAGNVPFRFAGENIAAKYVDGVAAVEGWLNSEGHRNTLLNTRFTHLGVGVNEKYYTQNFIQTW